MTAMNISTYELSMYICNPGISASFPGLCDSLCANPCCGFSIPAIISDLGSQWYPHPNVSDTQLGSTVRLVVCCRTGIISALIRIRIVCVGLGVRPVWSLSGSIELRCEWL